MNLNSAEGSSDQGLDSAFEQSAAANSDLEDLNLPDASPNSLPGDSKQVLQMLGVKSLEQIKPDQVKDAINFVKGILVNNAAFRKVIVDPYSSLSANDQKELYSQGTLPQVLLNKFIPLFGGSYDSYLLRMGGDPIAPMVRQLVQLGLLPAPVGVSPEQLASDAASDELQSKVALRLASFLPVLRPYKPIIDVLGELNNIAMQSKTSIAQDNANLPA